MRLVGRSAIFDDMTWPLPHDTEWQLRYALDPRPIRMHAASIVEAYADLIRMPEKRRNAVIRRLREAIRLADQQSVGDKE
jgi:hypothetical protein